MRGILKCTCIYVKNVYLLFYCVTYNLDLQIINDDTLYTTLASLGEVLIRGCW